jgi:hypothetical protein
MSRKNQELIDPSSLTIDQLNELIKQKSAVVTSPIPEPSVVESTSTKAINKVYSNQEASVPEASSAENKEEKETKKCSYKPTRANQVACTDSPTVFYGNVGYCTKHRRTVQASNARKEHEEQKHVEEEVELKNRLEKEVLEKTKLERERLEKEKLDLEKSKLEKEAFEKKEKKEKMDNKVKGDVVSTPNTNTPKPGIVKKKIMPNKWGRFEDTETHILFDPSTKAAYGVQDQKTGKVLALENKHIAICKNNGWRYHLIEVEDAEVETSEDSEVEASEDDEVCEECGNKIDECICGVGDDASNSDEIDSEDEIDDDEEEEVSEADE